MKKQNTTYITPEASLADIERLQNLIAGYTVTASIAAAIEFKIADLLDGSPLSANEIATRTGVSTEAVYRLLRALASIDVVHERETNQFELTSLGSALRSNVPCSLAGIVKMISTDWYWRSWGSLSYTIQTGKPSFPFLYNTDFFSYIKENSSEAAGFHAGMSSLSSISDYMLAKTYDFRQHSLVVDVGGGCGGLLLAILNTVPALRGILYDLPHAIKTVLPQLISGPLSERCNCIAGDFLKHIPAGGDAYVLKHVLHGLDQEEGETVLRRVRNAMLPNSCLIIVDMVIPPGNEPGYAKFNDLGMMLLSDGGRERTMLEFETLFTNAGFTILKIIPAQMGLSVFVTTAV
jgi:hypothetical protein